MKLKNELNLVDDDEGEEDDGDDDDDENDEEDEEETESPEGESAANEETKIEPTRLSEEELMNIELYVVNNMMPTYFTPDLVTDEEVDNLVNMDIPPPTSFHPVFTKFQFSPRQVSESDIPLAIMSMMKDLDMLRRWCIERRSLAKFILMARVGYRANPYHNWQHAFSVTHFVYLLQKNLDLVENKLLTHLEALSFFISAICHDIDHRGTSNSFHRKTNSLLMSLYPTETSVLENHHYSQAVSILEKEGCNILANLTETEYREFLEIMKTVIMATDVANHFAILHDLQLLADEGIYNENDEDHHQLALCIMITASDLSDQTKDWKSAITAARSVYKEFLTQGDLEKSMGVIPMDMMNSDIAVVTDLQVSFVEKIAIPVYRILSKIFPNAREPYRGIMINRKKWVRLQFLYNTSREDPDEEPADPTDLQGIINSLDFEGAERDY